MPHPAITALLHELAQASPADPDATNQYAADGPPGNATRRANLALALELALARGPDLLIVGEAPGYNGALRTGVPFTSEKLLLAGVEPPGLFGAIRGFALATNDGRISAEPTATIVWRTVAELGVSAVGWNACPFHPHRPGVPISNRPPRTAEVTQGQPWLAQVRALFPQALVIAMGNTAARALGMLNIPHTKVRHPAQGGARLFEAGLRAVVNGKLRMER
ncbi:MAG: uracil-DNA glycosylase [Chloroflexaceae bacterium]|jgi:uracil-DNA glycosylase|nr:uracil-DNA glycosylase [Chloroflexaceae bacterium]